MGGNLQADSRPGQGSRFWFEAGFSEVEGLKVESEADQALILGYEGERRKVLLVDDRPENRWVLQSMLEPLGFALQTAKNGQEAVQQTQQFEPDLILMDLMMPIMDGFEAIQAIRAAPDITQPRIVVVSAEAFQADRQRAKAAGSDDYLVKPIDESLLIRALQEQLTLDWIYEELPTDAESEQTWLLPPPSELQVVYDIALGGNMREIHKQADHLLNLDPQYKPFVDKLHALADEFDDETIMALLEPHLLEVVPPVEELEALYELVQLGQTTKIKDMMQTWQKQDKQYQPFAQKITTLAAHFEEDEIISIIEVHLPDKLNIGK